MSSAHAVETFRRIVRCFSLISINVVVYAAHAVETFGRIMRGVSVNKIFSLVNKSKFIIVTCGRPVG